MTLPRVLQVLAAVCALVLSAPAQAETPILSAPEAQVQMETGDLVVLDIRRPSEWKATGIAKGAWPVSMHERDFSAKLQAIFAKHPPERVAMICATGGRTAYVTEILEKNGISGVIDLSEGMKGNHRGPGWLRRGLPVVTPGEAQADFEAAMADALN